MSKTSKQYRLAVVTLVMATLSLLAAIMARNVAMPGTAADAIELTIEIRR